jgi:hypothetical protein
MYQPARVRVVRLDAPSVRVFVVVRSKGAVTAVIAEHRHHPSFSSTSMINQMLSE